MLPWYALPDAACGSRVRYTSTKRVVTGWSRFTVKSPELAGTSLTVRHSFSERIGGTTAAESAELKELRRRNRLLEQKNEVLRRAAAYLSQANLPGK